MIWSQQLPTFHFSTVFNPTLKETKMSNTILYTDLQEVSHPYSLVQIVFGETQTRPNK